MTGGGSVRAALIGACVVLAVGLPLVLWRHFGDETVAPPQMVGAATTADVQGYDQLERDLQSLQRDADLGPDAFHDQTLALTLEFLQLDDDAAARFTTGVDQALEALRTARARMNKVNMELATAPYDDAAILARREAWSRWQGDQRAAGDLLRGALPNEARQQLLATDCLHWLLALDYGLRQSAER